MEATKGTLVVSDAETLGRVHIGSAGTLKIDAGNGTLAAGDVFVDGSALLSSGTFDPSTLQVGTGGGFTARDGLIQHAGGVYISVDGTFTLQSSSVLPVNSTGALGGNGLLVLDIGSNASVAYSNLSVGFANYNLLSGALKLPSNGGMLNIAGTAGTLEIPAYFYASLDLTITGGTLTIYPTGYATGQKISSLHMSGGTLNGPVLDFGDSTDPVVQQGGSVKATVGLGNRTWNQSGGTNSFSLNLGTGSGSNGKAVYNLSGGTANCYQVEMGINRPGEFNISGTGYLNGSNEDVGTGATGTINQSGGTNTVTSLEVGKSDQAAGTYNLSSGTLNGTIEFIAYGLSASGNVYGTLVQTGGVNHASGYVAISNRGQSHGIYQMNGGTLQDQTFNAGQGPDATFSQTAGQTTIAGALNIGGIFATTTAFNLSEGSISVGGNANVGFGSPASLNQTAGTLDVAGNLYVTGNGTDGANTNGSGVYNLSNTGRVTVNGKTYVGYGGNGTFNQSGGTHITSLLVQDGPSGTVGTYNRTVGTLTAPTPIHVVVPAVSGQTTASLSSAYTLVLSATTSVGNNAITAWSVNWGDNTPVVSTAGTTTSLSHTYTTAGAYQITAAATGGSKQYTAAPLTVTASGTPPVRNVDNGTAVGVASNSVLVSWTNPSGYADIYKIERSSDPTFQSNVVPMIRNLPANTTTYVDAGLAADTQYYYRISAEKGNTTPTTVAAARTLPAGSLPITIAAPGGDGAAAAGGMAAGADGGDPMAMSFSGGAVRYSDGREFFSSTDLDPAEPGVVSGFTRTWSSDPMVTQASARFGLGAGWVFSQIPTIVRPNGDPDTLAIIHGGEAVQWFDRSNGVWVARYFGKDSLVQGGDGSFSLTDTLGNTTAFNADGRVSTWTDADGNVTNYNYTGSGFKPDSIERHKGTSTVLERLAFSYDAGNGPEPHDRHPRRYCGDRRPKYLYGIRVRRGGPTAEVRQFRQQWRDGAGQEQRRHARPARPVGDA